MSTDDRLDIFAVYIARCGGEHCAWIPAADVLWWARRELALPSNSALGVLRDLVDLGRLEYDSKQNAYRVPE